MIFPLFRRPMRPDTISALYGTIVAQARMPCFYHDYAVADTVNGRFDLIVLHLALVLDRLAGEPALRDLGQGLFDRFCRDMDDNLREMGIGDLKVPKEMRRMGEAFYGRAQAYRAALAAADEGRWSKQWRATFMAARPQRRSASASCGLYEGRGTASGGAGSKRAGGRDAAFSGPRGL